MAMCWKKLYVAACLPFTALGLRGRNRIRSRSRIPQFRVGIKLHWAANPRVSVQALDLLCLRISLGLFPVHISNVGICLRFLVLFHPCSIWICGHFQMWSIKNLCCVTLLRQWARATRTYDTQFQIFSFALRKSETACSKSLWLVLIVIKVSHNTHI